MRGRIAWIVSRILGRMWFRVGIFGLAALAVVALAAILGPLLPEGLTRRIEVGATREILSILASAMLVVSTFSLGIVVQAFAAAESMATPRASRVLIEDPFSQTVLSTFLGAFVFAICGIYADSLGFIAPEGEAMMLLASAGVIAVVIFTLIGWLDHLASLVRQDETIRKLERRAEEAALRLARAPLLGAAPIDAGVSTNWPVPPSATGYVAHIDLAALQKIADAAGGALRVVSGPGAVATPAEPLVRLTWQPTEDDVEAIRDAFAIELFRSFEDDLRFCLEVLAEVGSRALSPGVNDPGTAITVITAQQRLLTMWSQARPTSEPEIRYPRVMAEALDADDLFEDAFAPLARDGAGLIEVGLRLQNALAALAAIGGQDVRAAAVATSARSLRHAENALRLEADFERLAAAAAPVTAAGGL